jgi:tRNA(Ile)-lysidine synthase
MKGQTRVKEAEAILVATSESCKDGSGIRKRDIICLDLDKITAPLVVRNFRKGDRIRLKGMTGRKKVKDFFIDEKIPRQVRKNIPLLVSGEEVLWIVGYRVAEHVLADSETVNAIHISKV